MPGRRVGEESATGLLLFAYPGRHLAPLSRWVDRPFSVIVATTVVVALSVIVATTVVVALGAVGATPATNHLNWEVLLGG